MQTPETLQIESDYPRLLLASNREPFRIIKGTNGEVRQYVRSMGGLTSALCPVLERCEGVWVSWNPEALADGEDVDVRQLTGDGLPFPVMQVGMRESEVKTYYNGFCNRALWPLCHTVLRCVTPRLDYWQDYRHINERFADAIAEQAARSDVIWIHDYHLMLVPAAIRRRIDPKHRVGYFHHVPFPNSRVLKAFPWHRQLIKGLLGADSIGFHTAEYASNFIECCQELLSCDTRSEPGSIIHGKHKTVVRVRPIGVDAKSFAALADEPDVQKDAFELRRKLHCERLVLSVDRLDYTKGILERVEAIRSLFSRLPQCRGVVTFMQVAVPTREDVPEYQQYRLKLEAAVHSLNAEFEHGDWKPLIYRTIPMNRRELVAHYLAADIACVTPIADGMNLVASEYCATRTNNDGVLVLSNQAGISATLGEHAVCVDVRRQESLVTGILQALTMHESEQTWRMQRLRALVMRNTTDSWLKECLNDILQPEPADEEQLSILAQGARLHSDGEERAPDGKSRQPGHPHHTHRVRRSQQGVRGVSAKRRYPANAGTHRPAH